MTSANAVCMTDHNHLWVEDGDRIVCTHCGLDLKDPMNQRFSFNDEAVAKGKLSDPITITVVPESTCPQCGGGDEFFNRPKVALEDGIWWWRCYNPACPVGYYNPDTGEVELTPTT